MVQEVVTAVLLGGDYQVAPTVCHLCTSNREGGGQRASMSEGGSLVLQMLSECELF